MAPISEPVTMATDYALGLGALCGGVLLWRAGSRSGHLSVRLWGAAFFAVAVAAILGGTWHGFSPMLFAASGWMLWKATLAAAGFASFFLVAAAAIASVARRNAVWIVAAAAGKLALFLVWTVSHDEFDPVIYDSASAMAAVLALELFAFRRSRDASAPWIVAGILLSFAAAAVEALRLSPGGPFTHNDLYHAVQLVGLFFLYRGGRLLRDQGVERAR